MSMHWSTMSLVFSQCAKCCACSAYIVSMRSVVVDERATVLVSLHPVGRHGDTRSSHGGHWGTPRSCHPTGRWHKTDLRQCRRKVECSERLRIPESSTDGGWNESTRVPGARGWDAGRCAVRARGGELWRRRQHGTAAERDTVEREQR